MDNYGGLNGAGHVRIYQRDINSSLGWTQLGQDIDGESPDDHSGHSVSLSNDGNIVAVSATDNDGINGNNSGHVRIYQRDVTSSLGWTQLGQDIDGAAPNDHFGFSTSISSDGNKVSIGARFNDGNGTDAGHVRVFSIGGTQSSSPCSGCTDSTALNFDPNATVDNGSCYFCYVTADIGSNTIRACDSALVSTNLITNGSYLWSTSNTTNSIWVYNSGWNYVTVTDSSRCTATDSVYVIIDTVYGCTNPYACNYDPLATCNDHHCILPDGCTDPLASNYNSTALCDDGSCLYCDLTVSFTINQSSDPFSCDGWTFVVAQGTNGPYTYLWNNGSTQNYIMNLCNGIYTVTVTDAAGCIVVDTVVIGSISISGCTDSTATNFDPLATVNDGSCQYTNTCGGITGVNLIDIIHDRATFNWDNMNSSTCDVDQIRFRYREVGTNSWSTKTMGVPVGSGCNTSNTSKLVLGLTPSTTYEYDFKIWYCNASTVNWHINGSFTTLPLCDNVINIIPTPITTTKTTFCWDTVSTYAFVRLKYREDVPGSSFSNIGGMGVHSPTLCKDKNGLTPGLTYRVMWRTWCNQNGGPYRSAGWDGPVLWTQPTSIRIEGGTINNLEIYPNPIRDVFNVSFISDSKQSIEIRVVNLIGEVIFIENLEDFEGKYTHSFNLEEYSKGVYLLELDTDNGIVNKKLMLQ